MTLFGRKQEARDCQETLCFAQLPACPHAVMSDTYSVPAPRGPGSCYRSVAGQGRLTDLCSWSGGL